MDKIKKCYYAIIDNKKCTPKEIEDSIQSIFNQSHKNIEIFIINRIHCMDEKISEFICLNKNIPIFIYSTWRSNGNILQTLKTCIGQSTGKYSAFIVAPAIYSANKIELQLIDMEAKSSYFGHTNFTQFNDVNENFDTRKSKIF